MLDSIHVGVTGLLGYQQGLRVIANNTANLNTPGYKSSTLQFTDLFYARSPGGGHGALDLGHGLGTAGTHLNFRQGDLRSTGNDFDLAIDGQGMFILKDGSGETRYTRAGQFDFDAAGTLIDRGTGSTVQGMNAQGRLADIALAGMRMASGKATGSASFTGNLSSTQTEHTLGGLKIFDAKGQEHALTLKFTSNAPGTPGSWKVDLLDGAVVVGTSEILFADGRATPATSELVFSYAPPGSPAQELAFHFGADATSFASGSLSTVAMTSQDGYAPGSLSKVAFDGTGTLIASYTNGQTVKGPRLALARFSSPDAVRNVGGTLFAAAEGTDWRLGLAGEAGFGAVKAGVLEGSNVDLSREFSDLVVMQRGYQASSQVISTANDMLQELFGMKRK